MKTVFCDLCGQQLTEAEVEGTARLPAEPYHRWWQPDDELVMYPSLSLRRLHGRPLDACWRCVRYETPFDGDEVTRRLDAALAELAAQSARIEAVLDRLTARLDGLIRLTRRLFLILTLGLTVELGLSVWILWRLR